MSSPIPAASSQAAPPRAWVLTNGHPGNTTQAVGLAEALGFPYEVKLLSFRSSSRIWKGPLELSMTLAGLDRARSDELGPPWPELAIGVGRSTLAVTRWIGRRSGGRTRTVQLGRSGGAFAAAFDAVIAPGHTPFRPRPNLLQIRVPINPVDDALLEESRRSWSGLFGGMPRPCVLLLVGGDTPRFRLDADAARRLAEEVRTLAAAVGGSVVAVTSRRTSPGACRAMEEALPPPHRLHLWRQGAGQNPYFGYLAGADALVVTGESESMLAETAATDLPLYVFPLAEEPPGPWARLRQKIHHRGADPTGGALPGLLVRAGVIPPRREMSRMHRALFDCGRARPLGTELSLERRRPLREAPGAAEWLCTRLGLEAAAGQGRGP